MIKIIITDDQALMRDGLKNILNLRDDIDVVGTASNGREAFEKAKALNPDIILMDIRMPEVNGVEGTRLIKKYLPNIRVLMLTTFNDSDLILEALNEGASGYLLKDMPTDIIAQAIMTVYSGGVVLPQELTLQVLQELQKKTIGLSELEPNLPPILKELTERERDVLKRLGHGLNNKEIARELVITEGTVKNHVSNIIMKLELRDRTQAAIFAVRYGITTFET